MSQIEAALDALGRGKAVIIPTETVYGIAVRPDVEDAVDEVFRLKGRPDDKPLPILGANVEQLMACARFDQRAVSLARRHWPGGVTLVLERADGFVARLGRGNETTVAVRVPDSPRAVALLERSGPLAVTSANRSGSRPAMSVEEAGAIFGDEVEVYLDGGRSEGTPSTVLSIVGRPRVLREGAVPGSRLLEELGAH